MKLRQLWDYIGTIVQHESLSPALFTIIRLLVSEQQKCEYCVGLNAGFLMQEGMTEEQIDAIKADPQQAPLNDKEKALLLLVMKAAKDSNSLTAEDMDKVRAQGASDREIYDAIGHAANQMWGDMMLNAFKVERDF